MNIDASKPKPDLKLDKSSKAREVTYKWPPSLVVAAIMQTLLTWTAFREARCCMMSQAQNGQVGYVLGAVPTY